jgi:hypothetical protein
MFSAALIECQSVCLTLLVTCRRPTAAVQFKQIRKRAAVKWNR